MLLKPSYTSVEGGEVSLNNLPLLILKNLLTQKSDLRRLKLRKCAKIRTNGFYSFSKVLI